MEGRPAAAHAHGCRPRPNEAPLTGCSGGTKGSERRQLPGARMLAGPRRQRMRALARLGASAATALAGAEPPNRRQRGLVRLRSGGRESGPAPEAVRDTGTEGEVFLVRKGTIGVTASLTPCVGRVGGGVAPSER